MIKTEEKKYKKELKIKNTNPSKSYPYIVLILIIFILIFVAVIWQQIFGPVQTEIKTPSCTGEYKCNAFSIGNIIYVKFVNINIGLTNTTLYFIPTTIQEIPYSNVTLRSLNASNDLYGNVLKTNKFTAEFNLSQLPKYIIPNKTSSIYGIIEAEGHNSSGYLVKKYVATIRIYRFLNISAKAQQKFNLTNATNIELCPEILSVGFP